MKYCVTYKDLNSWYCCICNSYKQAEEFYLSNINDSDFSNMTISDSYTGPNDVNVLFYYYGGNNYERM